MNNTIKYKQTYI